MAIIISHRIKKGEFKKGVISNVDLTLILKSYKDGIFVTIKGDKLPASSRLIKVYATTIAGAKRIVYLVDVDTKDAFFMFFRSKNDPIGKNISIHNPKFKQQLHKYLDYLDYDLNNGNFDKYNI